MNTINLKTLAQMQAEINDLQKALEDERRLRGNLIRVLRAVARMSFAGGKSSVTALSSRLYRINELVENTIAETGGAL